MEEIFQPYLNESINLDNWVKEIMKWHFSEETGCDFWLERKKQLDFDPINDIKTYKDLEKFGTFQDEILKKIPMDSLIPRGYKKNNNSKTRVFETGGTLGIPKRIIDQSYRKEIVGWVSYALDKHNFPKSGNWLHLGPSGPHVIGHTTSELANFRGNGLCFFVDIDTRWIKVLVKSGDKNGYRKYIDHVLAQAIDILKTQNISCIMTTPKLLLELAEKVSLDNIKGILLGGTHVTKSLYQLIKTEIAKDIPLCINYGNTLAGVAPQAKQEDLFDVRYYDFFPYFMLNVVHPEEPFKTVEYNEKGRVRITVLTKDYFLPNLLERDEAIRLPGNQDYGWDGVSNVAPFSEIKEEIVEGVY